MYLGITYKASKIKSIAYELIEYINNNYVKDSKDCKSIIRYYFFINEKVVS